VTQVDVCVVLDVELVLVGVDVVVVVGSAGAGFASEVSEVVVVDSGGSGEVMVVVKVLVVRPSLQPNHPGVAQLVVVLVLVMVVVDCVDSSKQPHHPGVLHVAVRDVDVLDVVDVEVEERVVVVSEPLLSKNFQLKQSPHPESWMHLAGSSYCSITSEMTDLMR
jgi:hypothetical protein